MTPITPEDCAEGRSVRTVAGAFNYQQLFYNGGDLVARMLNDRNDFEVLVTADRSSAFVDSITEHQELDLIGFWRRRSGVKSNGNRGYIWCLVLLSWNAPERMASAA